MPEPTPDPPPRPASPRRSPSSRRSRAPAPSAMMPGERLHADGFDDAQIDAWAETFIAERSSGTVDEFVAWISDRSGPARSSVPRPDPVAALGATGSGLGGSGCR